MPRNDTPRTCADDQLPLETLVEMWKRDRPINEKTRTYSNYESSFARFLSHLERTTGLKPVVAHLSVDQVNNFLANGSERVDSFTAGSQASHGGNIRSLVSGCRKLGLVPADALFGFGLPKVEQHDPRWFTDAEVGLVFDQLEGNRTTLRLRLRAARILRSTTARAQTRSLGFGCETSFATRLRSA